MQMLFKSDRRRQQALLDTLKQHHPYQTPELLVLPVMAGDKDYLLWINASLKLILLLCSLFFSAAGGAGFAVRAEGRQPVRACRSGLRLRFQTARQPGDAELADPPGYYLYRQ